MRWILLTLAMNALVMPTCAEIVNLGARFGTATRDTMIFQNNVDNGAGGAPGFFAGANSQPSPRRGLIEFDLSTLPSGATVTNVELRLVIGQLAGSGGGANPPGYRDPVIGLHRLLVSWGEADTGRSTTNVLNGTGQGTLADIDDTTWNARFYDPLEPIAWLTPGGQAGTEYMTLASAELAQANERYAESLWQSTPALVADVQGWLDNPESNHGWMLINTNETDRQTFRGFFSHDYNPASLPTDLPPESELTEAADFWPVLSVTYEVDLPGDFDGDGDVDGYDFLTWQRAPHVGEITDWRTNYGVGTLGSFANLATIQAVSPGSMSLPEPSGVMLSCLAIAGLIWCRRFGMPK